MYMYTHNTRAFAKRFGNAVAQVSRATQTLTLGSGGGAFLAQDLLADFAQTLCASRGHTLGLLRPQHIAHALGGSS